MIRVPLYIPRDGQRVLTRVVLAKSGALPRDHTSHYRFRVGVQTESRFTVLGEYAGNANRVDDGGRFVLFDGQQTLSTANLVSLEADRFGAPGPLYDATIQVTTTFRSPLTGKRIDPELSAFLRDAGALERETVFPLGHLFEPFEEAKESYTTSDKTITAGAGATASDVSVTFTKPSWATVGKFEVTAFVDCLGAAGGAGALDIHDGTTAWNTIQFTTAATFATSSGTGHGGSIFNTTTLTLRATATTANLTLQESLIYGTCSWA